LIWLYRARIWIRIDNKDPDPETMKMAKMNTWQLIPVSLVRIRIIWGSRIRIHSKVKTPDPDLQHNETPAPGPQQSEKQDPH
jgi:hypothetical protein